MLHKIQIFLKKNIVLIILLVLMVLMFQTMNREANWNIDGIEWHSYEEGARQALASGKPALMVFHADWCGYCKQYSRLFFDEKVAALSKDFVMIIVDIDQAAEINQRYAPDGGYIPRTVFMSDQFEPAYHINSGAPQSRFNLNNRSPEQLQYLMQQALDEFGA